MSSYRQITALTVVSASLFYLWSRYYRKKKSSQNLSDQKPNCGGPSVSAVNEDNQKSIVTVASIEVSTSGAPLDKPFIQADLADVPCDSLVHLNNNSEGVFFHQVAESSEVPEEEAFISTLPHPLQIDPVAEAHKIPQSSFLTARDCTPIIELNTLTDALSSSASSSTNLDKSDKVSYEDPVGSIVIPEVAPITQDLVGSAAIVQTSETALSSLESLNAEFEGATPASEGSSKSTQNTQEGVVQITTVVEPQITPVKPVAMECLNATQREVTQTMLGVDARDSVESVKTRKAICEPSAFDEPQIAANTEVEVRGYTNDVPQEVSGLISVVQDSVESVDIISSAFTASAFCEPQIENTTELETMECDDDAHCVVGSTNVKDLAEPIGAVETLLTVPVTTETAISTATELETVGDLDANQEVSELANIVTDDLGEHVEGVQEAITPSAPVSSELHIPTSLTDSGALKCVDAVQREALGPTSLESVCVQASSASLMTASDVASGVTEPAGVLDEAVATLSTSIDAVSPQSGSCESVVVTSDSDQAQVAPEDGIEIDDKYQVPRVPKGIFNDPEHDIVEAPPEDFDGTLIPRVLVPGDLLAKAIDEKVWVESINVPACMGGVLIGRFGKNVRELRTDLKAEMTLSINPGCQNSLLLKITCPLENKDSVNEWVTKRLNTRPSQTTIGNPNQLQRLLPLGQLTEVMIRSLYGQKEFFVTIQDAEYTRYREMQEELDKDYYALNTPRMQLYEPVTSGTVAILVHRLGFARVVILKVLVKWRLALCFMLDHGVFAIAPITDLRKIKAKYMRVAFQAIHISWAHALPVFSDVPVVHLLRTLFADRKLLAFPVRMETCCRSSVVFLDRSPTLSTNGQPVYRDLLYDAYRNYLFHIMPVFISPSRQMWINRTDTPYYVCPYSSIPYDQLVHYLPELDVQQPHQEQTQMQQQHNQQQQQPQQQLPHHQQQQRGGPSRAHNRARRFGNSTSCGGGSHKRTQNPNTHHQNGRRSRKNGPNHNNDQQRHQQQTKKKEPTETAATPKT
ncbi:unnamed protein product [Taenia asiatica]|uniref:Tudor domain-containing protein n=1 Tax=Taenia asiatica TaxID=60517 RepID=A0A0R3WEN3_TAEAS|nr:unnamed protein product [Taenia asiatica]